MRYIAYFLLLVIAAFNYQLWFGKGGWNDVWELEQQIEQQKQQNRAMAGEVQNLKDGGEALMEVARSDFNLIQKDEVFYRIAD